MAPINFRTKLKTFILFPTFLILFGILILFIIATVAIPNGKQLATKLYKLFGWMGLKMVGINLTISGLEKIDKSKSYVVVGNHPSTLDIFTHIYGLPISIRFLTNEIRSDALDIKVFTRKCITPTNCVTSEKKGDINTELKKKILKTAALYEVQKNNKTSKEYKGAQKY